ncbi:hypothetical protein [Leptospira sp. GIMC2001]|uniref:hypothetical protein n=1 Tax=Leptospira sp. GIMC2001 TaxID=1513297 RepID=UPI00234A3952|nr:hypothetical protein [Leptospira sp. GIMC2001]WCL50006.1 hypothetical protein O4O04_04085 [Leptospira sp. GIMC2001]
MKILFKLLIIAFIINCQNSENIEYIQHPVTISFSDFLNSSEDLGKDTNSIERKNLNFQGFSISSITLSSPSEKFLFENSDVSYFVIQGALIVGESKKGNIMVENNQMFIVPRNTQHSLVPANNKPVKIIIHKSSN